MKSKLQNLPLILSSVLSYLGKYLVFLGKYLVFLSQKWFADPLRRLTTILVVLLIAISWVSFPNFYKYFTILKAPTLKQADIDSPFLYSASTHSNKKDFSVFIGESATNNPQVDIVFGTEASASFKLKNLNQNIKSPAKNGNKLLFSEVRDQIDITYETLPNGVKEEIVIKAPINDNAFSFSLSSPNAFPKMTLEGNYIPFFYDYEGNYAYNFVKPFAYDSNNERTENVTYKIIQVDGIGNYDITVIVDQDWLKNPNRVYPVYIDPTIVYDTNAEVAVGTFNRVTDTNTFNNDVLQLSSTNVANANAYTYVKALLDSTVVATGDTVEYDVFLTNNSSQLGGLDIKYIDTSFARSSSWLDQNGVMCHPSGNIGSYAYNQWFHRICTIMATDNGKTINYFTLVNETDTATATTTYYDNIIIKNSSGQIKSTVYENGSPDFNSIDIASDAGNTGTVVSAKNSHSTSPVNLSTYYQELSSDINTRALYHFSNDACTTDSSGNGYTLTANGGMTCVTNGLFGYTADNFATTPVSYSNTTLMDTAMTSGTIEAWVNFSNTDATNTIFYADSTSDTYLTIGTQRQISFSTSGSTALTSTIWTLVTDTWFHIAAVWSPTGHKIYINGLEVASDTNTTTHSSQDYTTYIGVGSGGNTNPFSDRIDDLRISNIARTPEEIKLAASRRPYSVYTSPVIDMTLVSVWNPLTWTELGVTTGDGETLSSSTNLVAQWNFNETSGTTADNAEGTAALDFTLNNFASTGSQDAAAGSGWTADNKRWGTGALMLSSVATADTLSIANPANNALDPNSSDMTIEMWVKTLSVSAELMSNNSGNGTACTSNGWYLQINASGQSRFFLDTNGATAGCDIDMTGLWGGKKINDGNWHHLAISVRRGAQADTYLDGVRVGYDSSVTSYSDITVAGNVLVGSTSAFNGVIDSARFYSRALTQNEIISNYQAGNVELQTRVGATTDANDGSWEAWKPTTGETQIASFDTPITQIHDSLISYWKLEEATAATRNDSKNTNNLTQYNSVTQTTGKLNYSAGFAAASLQYLTCADASCGGTTGTGLDFDANQSFSVSAWFKTSSSGAIKWIVSKKQNAVATNIGWGLYINSTDNVVCTISDGSAGSSKISSGTYTDGAWHHAVCIVDQIANTTTLYVDGSADGSPTDNSGVTGTLNTSYKYCIGNQGGDGNYFNGDIDEVAVWGKALSSYEAISLYNANSPLGLSDYSDPTNIPQGGGVQSVVDSTTIMEGSAGQKLTTGRVQADRSTVGLWHLDETGGTGAYIKDSSTNVNHGTPTGTTLVNGFSGKARSFNGSSDFIGITDSSSLQVANVKTVSLWINPTNLTQTLSRIIEEVQDANNSWSIIIQDAAQTPANAVNVTFKKAGVTANKASAANSIVAGVWQHVVAVYDGTNVTAIYINGVSQSLASPSGAAPGATTGVVNIGKRSDNQRYFAGKIDEIQVWSVAISAEQAAELYRSGRDHYLNKTISSTDLSAKTSLPFYVASDRQGTFMSAIIGESGYANYQTDASTTLLWHLDEQSGSGAYFKDSSGNGYHGTPTGTTYIQGVVAKARSFNGSTDKIESTGPTWTPTTFTVDWWHYPKSCSDYNQQVGALNGWTRFSFHSENGCGIYVGTETVNRFTPTELPDGSLSLNTWQHFAFTYDGTQGRFYKNGQLLAGPKTMTASTAWTGFTVTTSLNGYVDELRLSSVARTADQIRQAYEVGLRTHPITIDFKAVLNSGNLIANTSDLSFTIDSTAYGASAMGSNLFLGDKIIIKENYDGTEYIAQGTVNAVNLSTGVTTVSAWDAGSTVPSGGFTVNATVFKWQREYFDIRGSLTGHRDAITNLTLRVSDGSQGATVWLDDLRSSGGYLTDSAGSTVTSSTGNQYAQFRLINLSYDSLVSSSVSSVTFDYLSTLAPPVIGTPAAQSTTSIRWNFTDRAADEDGFKVFDTSNTLKATCASTNLTYCDETGLDINTQYTRKVAVYNTANGTGNYSGTATAYTLAAVPSTPTVNTRTTSSVNITPSAGTNPSSTELAIYKEVGSSCDGSGGSFIAANGSDNGATPVWQTAAAWSTVTASGLDPETEYSFCVVARNGDNIITSFSSGAGDQGGLMPLSGDFTITTDSNCLNRKVDGDNLDRYICGLDSGTTTNTAVLTLESGTLSLQADETLVVGSLELNSGAVFLAEGAQILIGSNIYAVDADTDSYPDSAYLYADTAPSTGEVRRNTITTMNTIDCKPTGTNSNNVYIPVSCYLDADNDEFGSTTAKTCANNATCSLATYASGADGVVAAVSLADNNSDCDDGEFNLTNLCCIAAGGACSSDDGCCSEASHCGTNADSDSYYSLALLHTGTCQASDLPYTDCDDGNAGVGGAATWYQDSDSDTYGNPNVSQVACSQPSGYVSNNSDCYDSNANAKPGQTSCYSTHRGDGSYDYNCVDGGVACSSCATSRSIDQYGTSWRQCLNGLCWTDPDNIYFFPHRCSGSTSTCGASGYTCSGSKYSSCSAPCNLSNPLNDSSSGCNVTCK